MTVCSLRHSRTLRLISALLSVLLFLPSVATFAQLQPRVAGHARQAAHTQKPLSALKVGDIIPVRSIQTGKVELKRVTFAGKHTYPFLLSVQTISKGKAQVLTCPPDQQFKLSSGRLVPAARLAIGNSIVTRAGPATVRAMAQLHKPGGFVVCDVRVGPAPTARRPLFRTARSLPVQFADYHQPRVSRTASDMLLAQGVAGGTPNSFLFAGQQYDQNLGLYYLRARYYAPTLGRFLSQDPFAGDDRDPVTLHRYLYAGNDPVNHIDPSGQDFDLPSLGVGSGESNSIEASQINTVGPRIIGQIEGTIPTPNPASIGGASAIQRMIALGLAGTIAVGAAAPAFIGVGPSGGAVGQATGNDEAIVWLVHGTTLNVAQTLESSPPSLIPDETYEHNPGRGFHTALDDVAGAGRELATEYAHDANASRPTEGGPALLVIGVPLDVFSAASIASTATKTGRPANEYNFLIDGPKSYGFDTLVSNWPQCRKYVLPLAP